MRENKKVLKFRKFKVANLSVSSIIGGTDDNPHGGTATRTYQQDPYTHDRLCETSMKNYDSDCTRGKLLTDEDASNCRG